MKPVQDYARDIIVKELKNKLGTELGIARLTFHPFNTISLDSLYLYDQSNEKVLIADQLTADIDLIALLNKKLIITSAKLSDFDIHVSKETSESPLNIQYIIDAFKPTKKEESSPIFVRLNSVIISNGNFKYDVKDKPVKEGVFDANHIGVSDFNARLAMKSLVGDSLNVHVKKLSLKENSGFNLDNLTCRLITQGKKVFLKGFKLNLPDSYLDLEKCEADLTIHNDSISALENIVADCVIAPSKISLNDISAFIPQLKDFKDDISIRSHISGSIDNIDIEDLHLSYGEKINLYANAEIRDIQHLDKMYILGSVDEFTASADGIQGLAHSITKRNNSLPKEIKNLGTITFQGDVDGYLDQLTAFGSFDTNLGMIKTDILFRYKHQKWTEYTCEGKIYTSDFELGKLLGNKQFDKITMGVGIDIEKPLNGVIAGKAEGTIFNIDFNDHAYKDITLNANYDGKIADGFVDINDPNGRVNINGVFDFTDKNKPILDFYAIIKDVQLDKLNLTNKYKNSFLSFNVNANFEGKDIDNVTGSIQVDSLEFIRDDKNFKLRQFVVNSFISNKQRTLTIDSDILKGEISGEYKFATLIQDFKHTLAQYVPALIKTNGTSNKTGEKERPRSENNLKYQFNISNTESLSDILSLPVTNLATANIFGEYNGSLNKLKMESYIPSFKAAGMNIKSIYIQAENKGNEIISTVNALVLGKKNVTNDIGLHFNIYENKIDTKINFSNDGFQKAKGTFDISTLFTKNSNEDPLRIDVNLLPSELVINNMKWIVNNSHVSIFDGAYDVDNLSIHTADNNQEVKIDGQFSLKNPDNILKTQLKNINLEYIFQTLAIDVLKFGGYATGDVYLSSIEQKPYANTHLTVTDFKFNGTELGSLDIYSELDEQTNKVMLDGKIKGKEDKLTTVNGYIDPIKQALSLQFNADSIDVGFLSAYTASIFNKVEGRGSGNVHLYGNFSNVTVEGEAYIHKGKIGITFLNTDYSFSDTVKMKVDPSTGIGLIYFNDIAFTDELNNVARISGKLVHDYFRDFMYHVEMSAENFMVYNATEKQNPIFWGRAFATGNGTIGGDEKELDLKISMRTEEGSTVRMNFMENVVSEYNFITYKSPQEENDSISTEGKEIRVSSPIKTESGMEINMDFYVDVTPDAVIEMLMDPVGGDILRGTGSGAMQFVWGSKTMPKLYGNYYINRGSYNFTFQKLAERKFNIQDGSYVQFRGDPFEATLDVSAIYKVTANLNDLDKQLAQNTGQANIPVNCVLNLTGQLKHPTIGLDVTFPSSDAEVQRQIKSLMNTEDMINRQVAYLLLLSKFYTPNYADVDQKSSDFAAMASATLSNQLSKIISQIDDRWELGTNIRYSDANELTSTEVEVILSSRLLNDRLIINGNFGYRDNPMLNQEAFIGDIDLELLLNNSGSWRIKAYNHYNEKYYYTQTATQTQGVGLIYKKDFDKISDLFRKEKRKHRARQDSVTPIYPDSLKKGSALSNFIRLKK